MNDQLNGVSETILLNDGAGNDILTGGSGRDTQNALSTMPYLYVSVAAVWRGL